ncbi:oligosaccharide flippase family protein [Pseudoalteromonas sp. Isolate3]|uniref:lipopolysaccharide biosynthesis protein n=1 Tax=Pseudoalteromonas sp. Isolate3 TaxID=2908526 RepID=UPI001EFDB7BA|nr:oligosaccharide flippase family protein [Pseudoalteromonas sp. Isolate3]MCG9710478.1 oligosaccharide flippase family protein [Pseudoalteromonas sp. Isolate3]
MNKDVVKAFLSLSSFTALNHGSRIVLTLCLARLLSTDEFGTFAALLALCEILLLPASMGFASSLMRISYPLFKAQQHELLRGLKHVYLAASCLFGVIFVAAVVISFQAISPHQSAQEHVVYLLLLVPIGAIMQSQSAFLVALNKPQIGLITQQCIFELLTAGFCFLVYLIRGDLSLVEICILLFCSILCVVIYQYWLIKKMIVASTARYQTKQWCKDSLIMLASGAGTILVAKLDVLLVHHWFGAQGVSIFFPAVVIAGLLTILGNAANQYLKPILMADETTEQQLSELMKVVWRFNFAEILLLALLAKPLLTLYGESQLQEGFSILMLLLLGQLLLPARILASSMIKLKGNPLINLYVLLGATCVTVLMAVLLKDQFGLFGVAVAFSGGFILGALCRMVIVCTHMRLPLSVVFGLIR